jgi:hypothetical protein
MLKYFFIAFLFTSFAQAQENAPLIGSEATQPQMNVEAPQAIADVNRILVIGDSMAGGLGAGMARMAAGDETIQITTRFNESSGITRPDIYDWAGALPKIMEGKNFTSVVVLMGLNDRQDARTASGRFAMNTPEWTSAYQANTDLILDALKSQNAKTFWLSEPPMGDTQFDSEMKMVSDLQRSRVEAKGATYVDTRAMLLSPEGTYVDVGPDDTGEMRKLRQKDGVTFFKQGNNKFGQLILAAIRKGVPATGPVVAVSGQPAIPANPVFGQVDVNGVAVVAELGSVQPELRKIEPAMIGFNTTPATGTAAEKLFSNGEVAPAPQGRFDDYSFVAPPAN